MARDLSRDDQIERLTDWLADLCFVRHRIQVRHDPDALERTRVAAKQVIEALETEPFTEVHLLHLLGPINVERSITRDELAKIFEYGLAPDAPEERAANHEEENSSSTNVVLVIAMVALITSAFVTIVIYASHERAHDAKHERH